MNLSCHYETKNLRIKMIDIGFKYSIVGLVGSGNNKYLLQSDLGRFRFLNQRMTPIPESESITSSLISQNCFHLNLNRYDSSKYYTFP